ncbi:MAG: hypothetical protein ACE5K4_09940, partial [Candidatus Hydrothermarchaeota archaeon]
MNELIFATFSDRLVTGFTFAEALGTKSLSDMMTIITLLFFILAILLLLSIVTVIRKMRESRTEEFVETVMKSPSPLAQAVEKTEEPEVKEPEVKEPEIKTEVEPKLEEPEIEPPKEEIKESLEEPEIETPKLEELPVEEIEEGGFLLGEEWAKELLNELKRNIEVLNFEIKKISANLDSIAPATPIGVAKDVELIEKESKRLESELAELSIEKEANKAALNTLEENFKMGRISSERYMETKPKFEKTLRELDERIREKELKLHLNELEKKKESIRQEYIQKLKSLEKEIEKEREKILKEREPEEIKYEKIEVPEIEPEAEPEVKPEEEPEVREPEIEPEV